MRTTGFRLKVDLLLLFRTDLIAWLFLDLILDLLVQKTIKALNIIGLFHKIYDLISLELALILPGVYSFENTE